MKAKTASFSDFKRIQRMSLNEFNVWMRTFYQTAYDDGLDAIEAEFGDCIATVYEDRLMEILLSIKGIGQSRADQIIDAILKEGVFDGTET